MSPLIIQSMLLLIMAAVSANSQDLTSEYYSATCPRATEIVQDVVYRAIDRHEHVGPALLRLFQVDCFVNGCDGSVLLHKAKHIETERRSYTNRHSLRGFKVIKRIKRKLEKACPGLVSCADILAFAARDAVVHMNIQKKRFLAEQCGAISNDNGAGCTCADVSTFLGYGPNNMTRREYAHGISNLIVGFFRIDFYKFGGPTWRVRVGRKDSRNASRTAADSFIPRPEYDLPALISSFARVGLTKRDMVALSGAHTIGRARCRWYRQRAHYDSNIDGAFAESLRRHCKRKGKGSRHSDLDYATPMGFDNIYFKNLLEKKGLLHSDQALYDGGSVDPIVREYADDNDAFFRDFARAMIQMGNIRGPGGNIGEVRRHCGRVNRHKH